MDDDILKSLGPIDESVKLSTNQFGFDPCMGVSAFVLELAKRVSSLEEKVKSLEEKHK